MRSNARTLANAMFGARQDMASQSYNTAGTMRPDMGAIVNGQPSLPTPLQSMGYVNLQYGVGNNGVNPKGTPNQNIAGMGTTKVNIHHADTHDARQHLNDMGDNPAHPAAQLASYLFANRLTDPANFYRG